MQSENLKIINTDENIIAYLLTKLHHNSTKHISIYINVVSPPLIESS
jgi:hypothetical protein